jgi:hypothetical protein
MLAEAELDTLKKLPNFVSRPLGSVDTAEDLDNSEMKQKAEKNVTALGTYIVLVLALTLMLLMACCVIAFIAVATFIFLLSPRCRVTLAKFVPRDVGGRLGFGPKNQGCWVTAKPILSVPELEDEFLDDLEEPSENKSLLGRETKRDPWGSDVDVVELCSDSDMPDETDEQDIEAEQWIMRSTNGRV